MTGGEGGEDAPRRPGPVANTDLLARVLVLAGEVRDLRDEVAALRDRPAGGVDEGTREEVAALRAALERIEAAGGRGGDEEPPPYHPGDLDEAARAERVAELKAWVTDVLAPWHPRDAAALRPCWWEHPPGVAAVNAAWLAWVAAHQDPRRKPHEPAEWADRRLPAMVKQVTRALNSPDEPCRVCGRGG